MKRTFLVIDSRTLRTRPAGPATANIWLEINGLQYPMLEWNDFVVIVMGWWVLALLRLVRGASALEIVHFMDGPYSVEVDILQTGMMQFRVLKRDLAGGDELATGEAPAKLFVPELISQSREVLCACKRQNWWSTDAEVLESSVEALELSEARFRRRDF